MSAAKLPPAPRRPRVTAVLRFAPRIALLLASIALLPIAATVGMRLKGIDVLGTVDPALDAEHSVVDGRVEATGPFDVGFGGAQLVVDFRFRAPDGEDFGGRSFAPPTLRIARGDSVPIEFSSKSPDVCRVRGTRCNPYQPQLTRFIGFVLGPTLLLLLLWMRDSSRRRGLLVSGREARFEVLQRAEEPRRITLRYRYLDQHGVAHAQELRLRRGDELLSRIDADADGVRVVHDENEPSRHRVVTAADFHP
ncbi:MAG: hypothetical protein U1F36_13055 [Planctomycetota bacterium]